MPPAGAAGKWDRGLRQPRMPSVELAGRDAEVQAQAGDVNRIEGHVVVAAAEVTVRDAAEAKARGGCQRVECGDSRSARWVGRRWHRDRVGRQLAPAQGRRFRVNAVLPTGSVGSA